MPPTLVDLRAQTLTRLGDTEEAIWTADEIDRYLREGYQLLARKGRVFFDQLYSENLPAHFSVTQTWELAYLEDRSDGFDFGVANYTYDDERLLLDDEDDRIGPAWYTCPADALDGFLDDVDANTAIPATVDLPDSVAELDRLTWSDRTIDALTPREARRLDSRYELTAGDVYGYLWQQDGVRTLRKVRVPAQEGDTYTVNGSWGILRDPSDLSDETPTGTWGVPRQITGQHPLGSEAFGTPRRVYQDGMNVRIEHFRQGRPMDADGDECELPTRYALYLRDFAQQRALARNGAGQDLTLAAHYGERWQRGLARIARRVREVETQRVNVMGGRDPMFRRPPMPVYPYGYGTVVR